MPTENGLVACPNQNLLGRLVGKAHATAGLVGGLGNNGTPLILDADCSVGFAHEEAAGLIVRIRI